MYRGEIWWADLPDPIALETGQRRPVLIIQNDTFTQSRIRTVIVVILTSNVKLAQVPGNVLLPHSATSLPKDSVANISQIFTVDKTFLTERIGALPNSLLGEIDEGLRTILYL